MAVLVHMLPLTALAQPGTASDAVGELLPRLKRGLVVVVGDPRQEIAAELSTLLPLRLMDPSLELEFESVVLLSRSELELKARDQQSRFVAALYVASPKSWRLLLFEPSRRRAMSRELPGVEADGAALEAVIAILVSANQALAQGETLGDRSVKEALMDHEGPPPQPPARRGRSLRSGPVASPAANPLVTAPHERATPLQLQLSLDLSAEPLSTPGGYGAHWALVALRRSSSFWGYAGVSLLLLFPETVASPLGQSEFHSIQSGAIFGLSLLLSERLEAGIALEPFLERIRTRHQSANLNVVERETAPTWGLGARAGLDGWFWPVPSLGFNASSGAVWRSVAPVFVDSRGEVVLSTTPVGWFLRFGVLFRVTP